MKFEQYTATASTQRTEYYFTSTGPNGDFPKIIQYTFLSEIGVANLGFGLLKEDGRIDDNFRTANGDTHRILATVGNTVLSFTEMYPDVPVFATGSDPARTRLYRKMLTLNKEEIEKSFLIFGRKNNQWQEFEIDIDYDAFLVVRRKNGKFENQSVPGKDEEE